LHRATTPLLHGPLCPVDRSCFEPQLLDAAHRRAGLLGWGRRWRNADAVGYPTSSPIWPEHVPAEPELAEPEAAVPPAVNWSDSARRPPPARAIPFLATQNAGPVMPAIHRLPRVHDPGKTMAESDGSPRRMLGLR
jgi:hypothetical protein